MHVYTLLLVLLVHLYRFYCHCEAFREASNSLYNNVMCTLLLNQCNYINFDSMLLSGEIIGAVKLAGVKVWTLSWLGQCKMPCINLNSVV